MANRRLHFIGFQRVLQALARRPTLTELGLGDCLLGLDEMRLLGMALCKIPSLQTLDLTRNHLGSIELAEIAPALYRNTSIKVLVLKLNSLDDMESAEVIRSIIRRNKTITTLDLSGNEGLGESTGAVACIADGLGSNSTLLKIDLTICHLEDEDVSSLAQILGSRNTTLQKRTLAYNATTCTGVGVLLEAMGQGSHRITDLDLCQNSIGNEGARILARFLGSNALPSLTRLSLASQCAIGDDALITLVSALERNTSLLHLDLRYHIVSERVFLALAESLTETKVLRRLEFGWNTGLVSAMPLLLAGLGKNTSLLYFDASGCAPSSFPPTIAETARGAGGWIQEVERLGHRNRFLSLIRVPKGRLPPRGVWPRALAQVATLPDVIFELLHSKANLVPSKDPGGEEAAEDTASRRNANAVTSES